MRRFRFSAWVTAVAFAVFPQCDSGAQGDRFVQDRFVIGFWVDPPADEKMPGRYQEIADANFTLVLGGFSTTTPEQIERQLDLCRKYDLKALVLPTPYAVDALPAGPECWGYVLRDEPGASDFPALRLEVDAFRRARPGKLALINLFPNYCDLKRLGTGSYEEHVACFMEEVRPDVLCMDHYPLFKPGQDGRQAYCDNLDVMRRFSLANGVPFWNFFNTMPFGPHTDPTEAQLRWQVYTSLAYGAKGVLYFCYYTPLGDEFPKGGAIIGRDGRPTRHYDQAKRINAELKNLGPFLMKATSTGIRRLRPEDDPAQVLAGTPIETISRAPEDPPNDYLIGTFELTDGRAAVLLNNYRTEYSAWPTVEFRADLGRVMEVSKKTGIGVSILDDSPDMEGLQLSFDAAEGRLFLITP
ncbi:MAG TPA: hypothetical protein VMZ06_13830 [Candidatus Bathyarchaeia archaeon]|nr:hypothetical protein [Candidatus Bathyarchaeia archaeon]